MLGTDRERGKEGGRGSIRRAETYRIQEAQKWTIKKLRVKNKRKAVERKKNKGGRKQRESVERKRKGERSPFTRGGRAGGEAPRRQMKIMRTFLSGKIYKIVPVL